MDLGLRGKFALVTGGSHGIGRAIALALADEGCNVAICGRNSERVFNVYDEIKNKNVDALGITADITDPEGADLVMMWGRLHILVNNVGGGGSWGNPDIQKNSENLWREVYEKNVMTAIRLTTMALSSMRKEGWGRVITISSIYGHEASGKHPWYDMAKAAQISFMKNLSMNRSLVQDGITFNTVAPGPIMVPDRGLYKMQKEHPQEFSEFVSANCPLGRIGTPEEVANVVTFLCSNQASLVNGALVAVDGGQSRRY